jgi:hypothetical protein
MNEVVFIRKPYYLWPPIIIKPLQIEKNKIPVRFYHTIWFQWCCKFPDDYKKRRVKPHNLLPGE